MSGRPFTRETSAIYGARGRATAQARALQRKAALATMAELRVGGQTSALQRTRDVIAIVLAALPGSTGTPRGERLARQLVSLAEAERILATGAHMRPGDFVAPARSQIPDSPDAPADVTSSPTPAR